LFVRTTEKQIRMILLSETFSDPAVMSALYLNENAFPPEKLSGYHNTSV